MLSSNENPNHLEPLENLINTHIGSECVSGCFRSKHRYNLCSIHFTLFAQILYTLCSADAGLRAGVQDDTQPILAAKATLMQVQHPCCCSQVDTRVVDKISQLATSASSTFGFSPSPRLSSILAELSKMFYLCFIYTCTHQLCSCADTTAPTSTGCL